MSTYSIAVTQASQQLSKPKFFSAASPRQRIIAGVVCLAIAGVFVVFALAGRYNIDVGRWLGYCGFKERTGLPCPTCGMTTATLAFAQGKIGQAFYIQPACALLCSLAVVAAIIAFIITVFGIYFDFIGRFFVQVQLRYLILALLAITAAGWAVTLARAIVERGQ